MGSVRRSLGYSTLNGWAGVVFQIISTVVVARILTPEQTGVFAVAAVFAALASTFRDFGVGEYLIQERELTDEAIRAATTVNIAVSWAMAVLLFVLAPWLARFYRAEGVADVMRVLALNFLLIPFGAVLMAWYRRELDFRPVLVANVISSIVSLVVVVVLAMRGHGAMSLAWSALAGTVATVGASFYYRPKRFPSRPGLRGVRKVIDFGKYVSGIYIFGQLGRGAPEMVLGRTQDMATVGMFSRASGLVEVFHRLVVRSIMPVCLPYFARSVREGGSPVRGLLTSMSFLTAVGWPFLLFMAAAADPLVRLLYGPQWLEAIALARVLCLAAAIELVYYPAKEAMLAVGRVRESNQLQILMQSLRVLGLLASIPWGLNGAAWGLVAASALGLLASHVYLARTIGLGAAAAMQALRPSLWVSVLPAVPLCLLMLMVPAGPHNFIVLGAAAGLVTAAVWLLAMWQCRHPMWPELVQLQLATTAWLGRKIGRAPPAA